MSILANNSNKQIVGRDSLEERLEELAGFDPVSAGQIRQCLPESGLLEQEQVSNDDLYFASQWIADNIKAGDDAIIVALGAGGATEALLKLLPEKASVFLMEMNPIALARMFRQCKLEEYVGSDRLILAAGNEETYVLTKFFGTIDVAAKQSFKIFNNPDAGAEETLFYNSALKSVRERMNINIFNINTLIYCGPQWQFNTLRNLPVICSNPGISALTGSFKDKPAVIVGAGPSLDSAIPFLRESAEGFVVLATGTSLRALHNAGIRPDIVVTVDASKKTGAQFETQCEDLYLASSSIAYPPVLRKFKGVFTGGLSANPIDGWVDSFREPRGGLAAAGTVTASAIDLAVKMGCNPIVSIGFDLSFAGDGTTHALNTMYDGYKAGRAGLLDVPGNYCETVKTSHQFHCYISLMEDYITEYPHIDFINATRAGARIKGMRLEFPEILGKIAEAPVNAFDEISRIHGTYADTCSAKVLAELETGLSQLEQVFADSMQAARICNRLIMLLKNPRAGDEDLAGAYLDQLRKTDEQFSAAESSSILLDMSLWPISYRANSEKTDSGQGLKGGISVNKRSRELYEQIAGASKWTRDLLVNVINEMKTK